MNRRIPLAPAEGWLTVGLVGLLCVTMAWSIDDVAPILARGDFTDMLAPMAIAGMLAGLIGAKVGWGRWLTYLVGVVFAALIVPLVVGSILLDGGGTLAEAYRETATSLVNAATDLVVLDLPLTNEYGHYLLVLGLLVWGTAMFASYTTFGHRRPLNAIVFVGLILLVNMSLTTRDQLVYLVLFSLASLFLLIRYHVLEEQAEWFRRRIGDPASISGVYLRGGTLFIAVAIGGSLLLTNVASSDPLRGAWGGLSSGLIELSRSFQKYLPTGENSRSFGADFDPSGSRISGRWQPDSSLEVTIQLPPDEHRKFYWRAVTYDQFALNGWKPSKGDSVLRNPGEALLEGSADAPKRDVTSPVQFTVTPGRYTGRLILSPLTPSVIDQPATVSLVGEGPFLGSIERDGNGPYTGTALVPILGNEPGQLNEANLRAAGNDYHSVATSIYLAVPEDAMPAGGKAEQLYDDLVKEAPSLTPYDFATFLVRRFQATGQDRLFTTTRMCSTCSRVRARTSRRSNASPHTGRGTVSTTPPRWSSSCARRGSRHGSWRASCPASGPRTARSRSTTARATSGSRSTSRATAGCRSIRPGAAFPSSSRSRPVRRSTARRSRRSAAPPSRPGDRGINEPSDGGAGVVNRNSPAGPLIGMAVLLAIIVGALAFIAWQRGPRGGTSADHAYRTVTRLASRFGFGPRPTQTVYEFSGSLGEVLPIARPELEMVARAKVETSYGRGVLADDRLHALRDAERRLKLNLLRLAFRRRSRRGR